MEQQLINLVSERHHGTIALLLFIAAAIGRAWTAINRQGGVIDTLIQRGGFWGIYRAIFHGETPPKR